MMTLTWCPPVYLRSAVWCFPKLSVRCYHAHRRVYRIFLRGEKDSSYMTNWQRLGMWNVLRRQSIQYFNIVAYPVYLMLPQTGVVQRNSKGRRTAPPPSAVHLSPQMWISCSAWWCVNPMIPHFYPDPGFPADFTRKIRGICRTKMLSA